MLPFGVTIPTSVPQRSEFPEGLMNYPVFLDDIFTLLFICYIFKDAVINSDYKEFNQTRVVNYEMGRIWKKSLQVEKFR
jgi:hypothetical protein